MVTSEGKTGLAVVVTVRLFWFIKKIAGTRYSPVIFPREGRLWNFGGTHKIHKHFLTESTGSTCVGKEEKQCGNSPHTFVLMDITKFGNKKSIYKVKFGNHIGCLN